MKISSASIVMVVLCFFALHRPAAYGQGGCEPATEIREYISENGFRVELTNLGNLVGLENPVGFDYLEHRFTREGYVLAYRTREGVTRVVHNIYSSRSYSILRSVPDLLPVAFEAPAHGTRFTDGTIVTARIVVRTSDNLLQLVHNFTWRAGSGDVSIRTEIMPLSRDSVVEILSYKRVSDINIGLGSTNNDVEQWNFNLNGPEPEDKDGFIIAYCSCPPPIPGPGPAPGWYGKVLVRSDNRPNGVLIVSAQDTTELYNAGLGRSLANGTIANCMGVLGWQFSQTLTFGQAINLQVDYQVSIETM